MSIARRGCLISYKAPQLLPPERRPRHHRAEQDPKHLSDLPSNLNPHRSRAKVRPFGPSVSDLARTTSLTLVPVLGNSFARVRPVTHVALMVFDHKRPVHSSKEPKLCIGRLKAHMETVETDKQTVTHEGIGILLLMQQLVTLQGPARLRWGIGLVKNRNC
jgi:hypothetical protein